MQLVGYLDSPFVRRVAVSMRFLGIPYEHRELSIFRNFDEFYALNPLVKVPTIVFNDGAVMSDSGLIIDYLEAHIAGRSLMPDDAPSHRSAAQLVSYALVAMEKGAQLIYEATQRPPENSYQPWIDRLEQQLAGAVGLMEAAVADRQAQGQPWLFGTQLTQADISTAVAWRFLQYTEQVSVAPQDYPALAGFSERAEQLPEFLACPVG